ncbi:MAG: SDR family NAD(P)-dependent oxidoreductase [Rhodoferax sp.]
MEKLKSKVAVVTGAASGIGLAMARKFASLGMKIMMADIDAAQLARALAGLRAGGATAVAKSTDVSDEAQVNALAAASFAEFGAVHVLCNNAGVATPALRTLAWENPVSDWQWIYGVNVLGVLHGVRAFVPRMLAAGEEGHVVNTASVAGLVTGGHPYFVSKHAVACFTEGLYKDLKGMNFKVSASVLCPGLVRTGIMEAERHRPSEFGPATNLDALPDGVRAMAANFRAALEVGLEPAQVAEAVASAILQDQFYIVPAQQSLQEVIDLRMHDILARRNPTLTGPSV